MCKSTRVNVNNFLMAPNNDLINNYNGTNLHRRSILWPGQIKTTCCNLAFQQSIIEA